MLWQLKNRLFNTQYVGVRSCLNTKLTKAYKIGNSWFAEYYGIPCELGPKGRMVSCPDYIQGWYPITEEIRKFHKNDKVA